METGEETVTERKAERERGANDKKNLWSFALRYALCALLNYKGTSNAHTNYLSDLDC